MSGRSGHLRCPYCEAYGIDRLYLGSRRADLCACAACGARWHEDPTTGEVLGHGDHDRWVETEPQAAPRPGREASPARS